MTVDREKILQVAQRLVDKKRYDKAIVEYHKLVASDPGDVRTLLKIGDLHLKLDQYEEAISTYEQVGEFYYREGFSVKAIAVYKQIRGIIRRHASHLEGRYGHIVPRLAEIYTQLGLTSDALAAYDEVATRLRQEGRERDALDIFKRVVDLDPQNPIAHLRVADSRARLGDLDKAIDAFGEAARIMLKLGRLDDTLKVLERLLEYRQDPEYARMAGLTYLERGGPHDGMTALSKLQIAFKANPKDLETLSVLARAFDTIDQPKKAVEVLKEAARVAKDEGNEESFSALMEKLVDRAPDDPVVRSLRSHWNGLGGDGLGGDGLGGDGLGGDGLGGDGLGGDDIPIEEADVITEGQSRPVLEESIDEVFELGDGDIQTLSDDAMLFEQASDQEKAAQQLVTEAENYRASGHIVHAIQLLRDGLRTCGSSMQLRQKLSDLLLEAGDQPGAIAEKLILAQELWQQGDIDQTLQILDEVLLLQPGQPDALQLRSQLGFGQHDGPGQQQGFDQASGHGYAQPQQVDDLQLNVPLQSYDVESGGVDEALHRTGPGHGAQAQLDDPFASQQRPPQQQPPQQQPPSRQSLNEAALDHAELLAESGRFDEARVLLNEQLQRMPNHPLVLDRLADIDAMATQRGSQSGPYPLQGAYPPPPLPQQPGYPAPPQPRPQSYAPGPQAQYNAPQVAPQAGYAAPQQAGYAAPEQAGYAAPQQAGYAAPEQAGYAAPQQAGYAAPEQAGYAAPEQAGHAAPHQGSYAAPQQGYPAPPQNAGYPQQPPPDEGRTAYDSIAPEFMDQVRAGVRSQVEDGDAQTHYDLGVAYLEMGLHPDAISELSLSARDPHRECLCLSMIGTVHLQLGDLQSALEVMHRALNAHHKNREQELALGYEIANTYEMKGMLQQALHYFEWLAKLDANYYDPRGGLAERIQRLRGGGSGAQRRPGAPPGAPQSGPSASEVDQAVDDLFGKGN